MSSSRGVVVALAGAVLFLVVAGAVYLEILVSARSTDPVWAVTRDVAAGDQLDSTDVRQVRLPRTGDSWSFYTGDLAATPRRAAHAMPAGTIVFNGDVVSEDQALVTLTLKTPPPLSHGARVDVYAQLNGQTVIVGRGLVVDSVSGTACSLWVPTSDEPAWVTLAASNLSVYAARSSGIGVPQAARGQNAAEAIATLSGSGAPLATLAPPSPSPSPTRAPR